MFGDNDTSEAHLLSLSIAPTAKITSVTSALVVIYFWRTQTFLSKTHISSLGTLHDPHTVVTMLPIVTDGMDQQKIVDHSD